jgi:hypothetical protein
MTCDLVRQSLGAYVQHRLSGRELSAVRGHLLSCEECHQEYEYQERLSSPLRELAAAVPPPTLATSIRLQLFSKARLSLWDRWQVRLSNLMRPVALPAAGGLLTALILFTSFIPAFSVFRASGFGDDVPTMLMTGPRFKGASLLDFSSEEDVLVEAWIDENGKVASFEILTPPYLDGDPEIARIQSSNVLLTTLFEPATRFGQPIAGKVVMSLHRINIRP